MTKMKIRVKVSLKTVGFAPKLPNMWWRNSAANRRETSMKIPANSQSGIAGLRGSGTCNAAISSRKVQKSEVGVLNFAKQSVGPNCSNTNQDEQQSTSSRRQQRQLQLKIGYTSLKLQTELNHRQKDKKRSSCRIKFSNFNSKMKVADYLKVQPLLVLVIKWMTVRKIYKSLTAMYVYYSVFISGRRSSSSSKLYRVYWLEG